MTARTVRLRHDLRTAVNHILGYGEMLLEEAEAAEEASRVARLRVVRSTAFEVLGLVDAVLGAASEDSAEALARLRDALQPLAVRLLDTIHALEPESPERDVADLHRMETAVEMLLRFAPGGVIAAGDQAPLRAEMPAEELTRPVSPPPLSRILVADDDATNRDLLGRRLAREGHQVAFAGDGTEAFALLEAGGYDLALLDLDMPGLDGYEVLRRLKSSARLRELPVLMISANDTQASVGRCIAIGADDYLPKPFDPVLLRARVGACLERKRGRDQELEYLRQVRLLTAAAASLETGTLDTAALAEVSGRDDALGGLARVLERAAREVEARTQRLALEVQQLRIEIDETRKARAVAEIVETDYFHDLQRRAAELRRAAS